MSIIWTPPVDDWFDGVCAHCGVDIYDHDEWLDESDDSFCPASPTSFHEQHFTEQ